MRPVLITTPPATPDEVAEILGVPKANAKRLMQWALESAARINAKQAIANTGTEIDSHAEKAKPRSRAK